MAAAATAAAASVASRVGQATAAKRPESAAKVTVAATAALVSGLCRHFLLHDSVAEELAVPKAFLDVLAVSFGALLLLLL